MPKGLKGFQKGHKSFISKEKYKEIAVKMIGNTYGVGNTNTRGKHWKVKDTSNMRKPHTEERKMKQRGKPGNNFGKHRTIERRQLDRELALSHPNKKFVDTSIELKVEEELKRRNLEYKKQVVLCKIAKVDFLLTKTNEVIQCDGDYWHNLPGRQEYDAKQDKILRENGYTVHRFWEHEINLSTKRCIDMVYVRNRDKGNKPN